MGNRDVIDLYRYRFERGNGIGVNKLPEISVAIEWIGQRGWIAYFRREHGQQIIQTLECALPWKEWKLESLRDLQLFEDCLSGLKVYFQQRQIGRICQMTITVPYAFSYFQLQCIRKAVYAAGISRVVMDTTGMFGGMRRFLHDDTHVQHYRDIIYDLRDRDFELTMVESEVGVYESYGTVGIRCAQGWEQLSDAEFEKRIRSEFRQYFRDIGIEQRPDGSWDLPQAATTVYRVFAYGKRSALIEEWLYEMTGRGTEVNAGTSVVGGLLQCLVWEGSRVTQGLLRLSTCNKKIWVGLGENGERKQVIERYSTIPCHREVSLMLSTETTLSVYEGNYMNSAFDCLLAEIDLGEMDVKEGREIRCEVSWDGHGQMMVRISNHEGKYLVGGYEI